MNDERNIIADTAHKKSEFNIPFYPKRWLKNAQQRLYRSPRLYLLFCFITPFMLMLGIYLTRGLHPFGEGTPLVLDLNSQYAYFFEGLRNFIYGDASSLLYSFSRSLGGEFMGMYAYYLASPLSYIVALFPQDRIQEAILTILLVKTGLCGLSFGYYLHRHSRSPKKTIILTFSVMYALSAYAVCQQSNTMWIDALIWLPMMALGIEQLILNRKYKLYTISLTFILISNYYIGYMLCIFAVLFFFYCYFSKSPKEINPREEKFHFVRAGTRFAVFSILSAAIAAFMLVAAYYSLGFGKSEFSSPDWSLKSKFGIIDLLTKFLPGAYDTFEPAGLPFVYCGLLTLILLPVYFTAKKISSREKIVSGALIAIFFISFIVSPIDLIWHGFSTPNWLNGRYSFLLCFVLLTVAYKGYGNLRQAGEKFLLVICALIVLFIAVAEKFELESYINSDKKLLTFGCIWFSIFFTIALFAILCLKIRLNSKKAQHCVSAVLAAIVCLEVFCNGVVCFIKINDDVAFTKYSSYQNFVSDLRPTVEALKEYDNGFYRAEKKRTSSELQRYNFPFALALRGISNSTSTLNADAIQFIHYLGYSARSHISQYRGGTPVGDSLLGIKYVIDNKSSTALDSIYEKVEEIGDNNYNVYKNPYSLSLAYGVSDGVQSFDMSDTESYVNVFERYNALLSTMIGDTATENVFEPIGGLTAKSGNCKEVKLATQLRYTSPEKSEGSFSFTYTAPYTGNYYFYPNSAGIPGTVNVRVGSDDRVSFLERNSDHILSLGHFEKGSEIKITFYISKDDSINFYTNRSFLWYFNEDAYSTAMQKMLAKPQFEIDTESTDDHLFGNIDTADDEQMILTTIPYDEGWKVYVDGERVEIYETLDALMAFDIENAGEHTLELKYMPDIYKVGIVVSIIGISAFVLICAADLVLKKTLLKNYTFELSDDFWELEDLDCIDTVTSNDNQSSTEDE